MERSRDRRLFLHALAWTMVAGLGTAAAPCSNGSAALQRSSFPAGFVFGMSTSAYQVMVLQVEGAAREGGRGPSIWDAFTHRHPEKIDDGSNGDVAVDFYHRYKEDLKVVKEMGLDAFRFSISWSRILPNGKGEINKEGIAYYNNLIDELLSNGLLPFATIFHWDAPQSLEDEYGGFLSPSIIDDFRDYAEVCFREFGDRVKHWILFNEPGNFCSVGYAMGIYAPGRCSPWEVGRCSAGDSATEPYVAGHHVLLAHAAATKLYREKYQGSQRGTTGMSLSSTWFVPLTESKSNVEAAGRALDFELGWFMDPLVHGEYPLSMRTLVRDRLPEFTKEQSEAVKGSFDFLGINYYTSKYAHEAPASERPSYTTDARVTLTGKRNGIPMGPEICQKNFYIYPEGIKDLLLHIKNKYKSPIIFVTENGICETNNSSLSLEESLDDDVREYYHQEHLVKLLEAIGAGVHVKGYFAWSFIDNFEWNFGYTLRYGFIYVDFNEGLKRHKKRSVIWFQKLLTGGSLHALATI